MRRGSLSPLCPYKNKMNKGFNTPAELGVRVVDALEKRWAHTLNCVVGRLVGMVTRQYSRKTSIIVIKEATTEATRPVRIGTGKWKLDWNAVEICKSTII